MYTPGLRLGASCAWPLHRSWGGGWWTEVTLHFWSPLTQDRARIPWEALGVIWKLLSLCWNVKEDPSENVVGVGVGGGVGKELFQSLPSPVLGSLHCLPPSEGLVPGGGENVFSGLHPGPSEQESRPRSHSSLQFTPETRLAAPDTRG